jgi:hypothetical protein
VFTGTVDQLKNSLQAVINGISGYSAALLTIKSDLQKLVNNAPGESDSAAIALELVRVFVNNVWERYLADIINQIPDEKLRTALATLLQQTEGNLESFKKAIETWFNDTMDRVSGWYKRHTQWVQLILGIALTFALNLDSVSVVKALSEDNSGLLKTVVAKAEKFVEQTSSSSAPSPGISPQPSPTPTSSQGAAPSATPASNISNSAETLGHLRAELSALLLPIGWTSGPPVASTDNADFRQWPGLPWIGNDPVKWLGDWWNIIYHHFVGWLLTVIAVSLGAPFWFDLLSKIISIRASGDPPPAPPKSEADSSSAGKS